MYRQLLLMGLLSSLAGGTAACGGTAGSGTLDITTWGEDYIEQGIPATEFADGWSCHYDKFLIALGPLTIAEHGGDTGGTMSEQKVFDMTLSGPHPVTTFPAIGARHWDEVSIAVSPAGAAATVGNDLAGADLQMMQSGGYSLYVEGTLSKQSEQKTFAWGFTTDTLYQECQKAEAEGGELGVIVPDGGSATVQFTIHGDHLFYDDLASPSAVLRGQAIADADSDSDGAVTLDELDGVDLAAIGEGTYGTGGAAGVYTLGDFLAALTRTVVHFQGEGHCHSHVQ